MSLFLWGLIIGACGGTCLGFLVAAMCAAIPRED